MGKILLIILITITALKALFQPWIGISAYYLLALLGPQYIWFWNFQDLRVSMIVAVFAILGVFISVVQNKIHVNIIDTKLNRWILLLLIFVIISYYFGPYVSEFDIKSGLSPQYLLKSSLSIFLFYFFATITITDINKLKYFSIVIIVTTVYLIYWANLQYFTSNWDQFYMGRLKGPEGVDGGSIYADQNDFAMLFVTGLPFIYYFSLQYGRKWLRYIGYLIIIFGWHAVFLTGSRGGLLGLAVTVLIIILQSKRRYISLFILPVFYFFFTWQAGTTMKDRSDSISEYGQDKSAESRIVAWTGGMRMIVAHPITGVGLGSFITALPHYIDSSPRVAHNTFIQFTAESGLGAGLSYVMIAFIFFRNYFKIANLQKIETELTSFLWIGCLNNACIASFSGLVVCSIFISLNLYEIYYYLLIISNSLFLISNRHFEKGSEGQQL